MHLLKISDRIRHQIKKGHRKGVEVRKMKKLTWKITGINLEPFIIEADSFDSAIMEAREINKNYCSGQVIERAYKYENK